MNKITPDIDLMYERYPLVREITTEVLGLGYVAGSAARAVYIRSEDYADVDLIAFHEKNIDPLYARLVDAGWECTWVSHNAYTFRHEDWERPVQLLRKRYGRPSEVMKCFPLTVQQFALFIDPYLKLVIQYTERAAVAANNKLLEPNPEFGEPAGNMLRAILKYQSKGYTMTNPYTFFRICAQSRSLFDSDHVFADQMAKDFGGEYGWTPEE